MTTSTPSALTTAPRQWIETLRGGERVLIRPIQAEDMAMERIFIEGLSPGSRRFRFLDTLNAPSDALLRQLTTPDPRRDVAYVAVIDEGARDQEVGVGRFSTIPGTGDCEFALTVADQWQRMGLGTHLMRRLIDAARALGLERMHSSDASDNELMRKFAAHLHMENRRDPQDAAQVLYSLAVQTSPTAD